MRRTSLCIGMGLAWGVPALLAAGQPEVRILERTDHSVTLELATPEEILRALRPQAPVRAPGWAHTTKVGWPDLPTTGVLVPVPPTGSISLEVLDERHATYPEARPARVAPRGAEVPTADDPLPAGFYPAAPAAMSDRVLANGQAQVRILFHPFRFDPETRQLEASSRIRVRLSFQATLAAPAPAVRPSATGPATAARGRAVPVLPQVAAAAVEAMSSRPAGWTDAYNNRLRLDVSAPGWQRLAFEDLPYLAMGRPLLEPNRLRLTRGGQDVPLKVTCASGAALGPGDTLEFYAAGLDTIFSGTDVYCLTWDDRPKVRLHVRDGAPGTASPTVTSFQDTLRMETNTTFVSTTPGAPDLDYWFWERLTAPQTTTYTFTLAAVDAQPAALKVVFQGNSDTGVRPGHRTTVTLNGTLLGDQTWSGFGAFSMDLAVPAGLLQAGANTLALACPGGTGASVDQVWLNAYQVEWSRPLAAAADRLTFPVTGTGSAVIQVGGFTGADLRLLDITDPAAPVAVEGFGVTAAGGGYRLTFQDSLAGTRLYHAVAASGIRKPKVAVWPATGLLRSRLLGADYILVTSRAFLDAAEPLLAARRAQGLRAVGVAMEDVYGEFSHGGVDPQALRDFLTHAYQNWAPPAPRYVLLLGDASFDFRDYKGLGKQNVVPVHFSVMPDLGLTPDDNWYVTAGQPNDLPAMMVGRLAAASPAAASAQIQKILTYEQASQPASATALFVADDQDPGFQANCDELAALLPSTMQAAKVYASSYETTPGGTLPAAIRTDILNAFNQGPAFVAYYGHGNTGFWTRNILQTSDVANLTNTFLPLVMSFDCLTGYFAAPQYYSLGETLVQAQGRGAIAVFGSSGLGYNWEHEILGVAMFKRLFQDNETTLGVLATQSKLDAYALGVTTDTVRMFNLLGDPAMRIKAHP